MSAPMTTDRPTATDGPIDLDRLTLDDVRTGGLRGRPITVLGFARSGIALARFFADAGAEVTVYDGRPAAELEGAVAALDGRPVRLLAGPDVEAPAQPDDVSDVAADLRGIDVHRADQLEAGLAGHLMHDGGADRSEAVLQHDWLGCPPGLQRKIE